MRRIYITFGGAKYDPVTEQVVRDAPRFGVDDVFVYDDAWFEAQPFRSINSWLWDHPGDKNGKRGYGWYAFKTYILIHALDHCQPGDIVLYVDGDTRPIADLSPIYNHAAEHGAMFFAASAHIQRRWCTEQCLFVMGQDDPRYRDAQAGVARFMALRAGGWKERQFLYEWLTYAVNKYATTFDPPASVLVHTPDGAVAMMGGEHANFEEHRTEQAIMTNLCHKYGYPLHREADQSGDEFMRIPGPLGDMQPGNYPRLFEQTWLGSGHPVQGSKFRRVPT